MVAIIKTWENARHRWKDPLGFFSKIARQHGDFVKLRLGGQPFYFLNHPDLVDHVLRKKYPCYVKTRTNRPILGEGLLTSEGAQWKQQRLLTQPFFTPGNLHSEEAEIKIAVKEATANWKMGDTIDICPIVRRFALNVSAKLFFRSSLENRAEILDGCLQSLITLGRKRNHYLLGRWYQTGFYKVNYQKKVGEVRKIVGELLDESPREKSLVGDWENAGHFSRKELEDMVATLLVTGYETTANFIAWALYLLGEYPTYQDKPDLLDAVLQETLRFYPPAWLLVRQAVEEDVVEGRPIEKGATIAISPYLLHRDPRFWENPAEFHPERFLDEVTRRQKSFIPFGSGPRQCIGSTLAFMEARAFLSEALQRFRFVNVKKVEPEPLLALQPKGGVQLRIIPLNTLTSSSSGTARSHTSKLATRKTYPPPDNTV